MKTRAARLAPKRPRGVTAAGSAPVHPAYLRHRKARRNKRAMLGSSSSVGRPNVHSASSRRRRRQGKSPAGKGMSGWGAGDHERRRPHQGSTHRYQIIHRTGKSADKMRRRSPEVCLAVPRRARAHPHPQLSRSRMSLRLLCRLPATAAVHRRASASVSGRSRARRRWRQR